MQLYDCTVRLGGSMLNEVRKDGVTAAEIQVLRMIHSGGDSGVEVVKDITPTKHVDRDDLTERARLEGLYGRAVASHENIRTLQAILGHSTAPLPQSVPGVDNLPAPKSGRRAGPGRPKADSAPEPEKQPEPISEEEFS